MFCHSEFDRQWIAKGWKMSGMEKGGGEEKLRVKRRGHGSGRPRKEFIQ